MLKKTALLALLFTQFTLLNAKNHTISGYITDRKTGESLISATLFEAVSGKGAVSNTFGFYSLTLPEGNADLLYSFVGYQKEKRNFRLKGDTTINIQLIDAPELREVTVFGNTKKELGVLGSQMGAIEVPVSQIKSIPTLFGETDVLKALQLLPGVKAGSEGSAGLYVRGGGPDENLLLLDGIPVYNVNHMFGFFSVFNADAIKNVTLYKGNFPARFGGRLSSVIDIRMNDGNDKEYHGNVTVGLISSKINLEGPIIKEKTTFNLSYRRTYADLLIQPLIKYEAKKNGAPLSSSAGYYFYDLNAKISHKISNKDKLFLSLYTGDDVIYANMVDHYTYDENTTETSKIKMDWNWGNTIAALKWNHVVNSKLFLNTTAAFTRYRFDLGLGSTSDEKVKTPPSHTIEDISTTYLSGIGDYSLKADLDYTPGAGHDIKFGANYTYHTFRPGVSVAKMKTTGGEAPQQMDTIIGDKNIFSQETMLYAEDNISLGAFIKANVGLNFSSFFVQDKNYHSLQPRLSMRFLVNDRLSLKLGGATMSQYIHLLSNSSISLPTDLWVPVTKRISPMKSRQLSAGIYYNLLDLVDLSVESYYKTMNNLIEYKDGATFLGSGTGWEDKVNMGRGRAYGLEFLAQRSFGKTTGWLGYTWSKSERIFDRPGQEINFGRVFPAKYDRRHDVSLTLSHKFSERFDLSGTWVYSTGHCGTLALQNYSGDFTPDFRPDDQYNYYSYTEELPYISSRNNYRFNAYHRMDIGFNFHKKLRNGTRTWNISFYNAYNQLNPFMVYPTTKSSYDSSTGTYTQRKTLTQIAIFPILPSVSYSYKF